MCMPNSLCIMKRLQSPVVGLMRRYTSLLSGGHDECKASSGLALLGGNSFGQPCRNGGCLL